MGDLAHAWWKSGLPLSLWALPRSTVADSQLRTSATVAWCDKRVHTGRWPIPQSAGYGTRQAAHPPAPEVSEPVGPYFWGGESRLRDKYKTEKSHICDSPSTETSECFYPLRMLCCLAQRGQEGAISGHCEPAGSCLRCWMWSLRATSTSTLCPLCPGLRHGHWQDNG